MGATLLQAASPLSAISTHVMFNSGGTLIGTSGVYHFPASILAPVLYKLYCLIKLYTLTIYKSIILIKLVGIVLKNICSPYEWLQSLVQQAFVQFANEACT